MIYRRCGKSGIKLSAVSLGLWHNFGDVDDMNIYRKTLHTAFDAGITHYDLANNYGPPAGSAEVNFGKILKEDFAAHRDEMIISTKAGYYMWPGPYGEWGSKKNLVASLNQSLKRMDLDYVDIFYHHRPDPDTPLYETMSALDLIVRQGKALYVGISNYKPAEAAEAIRILKELGTPCLIHQPKYSMFERWVEGGLLALLGKEGVGCIPFDSRVAKGVGFLTENNLTEARLSQIKRLNDIAVERGQSLAQMALAWILRHEEVTTVLIGASRPEQLTDSLKCLDNIQFSIEELNRIEYILK
jgi:L-glyceraldehyde 3-phosphate reductase